MRGSETSHCFTGLTPDTDYGVTVFVQTPNLEGPGVSVREHTSKCLSGLECLSGFRMECSGGGRLTTPEQACLCMGSSDDVMMAGS